MKKYIMICDCI